MSKTYIRLGEKIRKLRKDISMTQEKLAELTSIDPKSIIQIESGKRNPTVKTLNKIARALSVKLSQLFEL